MSQSTDAILVYGIPLSEDFEIEDFEEQDTEEEDVAERERNPIGYMVYMDEQLDGCEIVTHCSDGCPMYILTPSAKDAQHWASRGYLKTVGWEDLVPGHTWNDTLKAFCEKHGVSYSEPQWLLCSWWG